MADYTLHLGYNWNSPTIGSIWRGEDTKDRFLQYALADASGAPAWFQFLTGDNLYVQLWDLSPEAAPIPDAWVLNMSLGPLEAGSTQTYDPTTYLDLNGNASAPTYDGNPYLDFMDFTFSGGSYLSPWGPCRGQFSQKGPVTFTSALDFKLSFYLKVSVVIHGTSESHVFLSDPEVIVGSRG